MVKTKKGLAIRTAFNSQGWAGRCISPLQDARCFKCREGGLFINQGKPIAEENGYCKGESEGYPLGQVSPEDDYWCWEQVLCKAYFWGNVQGRWSSVFKGMPVYFVYSEPNGTLTLWGHSTVDRVDNDADEYPPVYFEPFGALPQEKWVKGLTGQEITGKSWRQGNFRYLDENHERYLASLIEGEGRGSISSPERYENVSVELRRDIKQRLKKIADNEGREVTELIREAIAKFIRERG